MTIDTESFSAKLREKAVVVSEKKVLIARLSDSEQEQDLTSPVNCNGYGRIRHFQHYKYLDWSPNPLPILPAVKALKIPKTPVLRAQVFQNAACNWRCWYCFVDFDRLSADLRVSSYFTTDELIEMYLLDNDKPLVIDLSGGQPDLVPEWLYWTMKSIEKYELLGKVFLWSDDNLSSRYFWEYLSPLQRQTIINFPNYCRVACFKGYNQSSFSFNTSADSSSFEKQFEIYRDLFNEGLDMYAYVTFTSPPHKGFEEDVKIFIDRLQTIHPNLPLRTVPLKVESFTPMANRIQPHHEKAMEFQYEIHKIWVEELKIRFSDSERALEICDVPMSL